MFHFMVDIHIYFGRFGCFNGGRKSPHLSASGVSSGVEWLQNTSCRLIDPPTRFAWWLICLCLIKGNFTPSFRVWALVAAYAQNLNNVTHSIAPFSSAFVCHSSSYSTQYIPILRTIYGVLDLEGLELWP